MKYYFLALGTLVVVCVGCAIDGQQVIDKGEYHAPPAAMLQRPGPMVDLPYPAIMPPLAPSPAEMIPRTSQVRFVGPSGMDIGWQIPTGFAEQQMTTPGRYNFHQGATYRLKVTNIPGRDPMLVLYPTLQVYPAHPTTDAYLTHNSIPLQITDEDLDQIETNNFVTKVIYLPEPKFQELAIAGVETLVSTRLDPGVDPVSEADRRGTIMAVMRIGNMDLEMPGDANDMIHTVGHVQTISGEHGQFVEPMPIGPAGIDSGVPNGMVMGGPGGPGMPPYNPVAGIGGVPAWGMPQSGTPIGLVGPPHLPYGGPAGLKSHSIYNETKFDIGEPVDHFRQTVRHEPGIRMPHPVKDVEYVERHPVYGPNDVSIPAWYGGGQGGMMPGGYCPPGQMGH